MRLVIRDATAQSPNATLINLFVKAFDVREKIFNGTGESIEASARRIKINANYITALLRISLFADRAGSGCLNRFSAMISRTSTGVRLPNGPAAVGL